MAIKVKPIGPQTLMPIDHFDNRPVLKELTLGEYRADRWYSVEKSLPKEMLLEWVCKPY